MKYIITTILLILIISCSNNKSRPKLHPTVDKAIIPEDSKALYFPLKPNYNSDSEWFSIVGIDPFTNSWFSRQLFALREPIIQKQKPDIEVYRFTWLRSFHKPIAIRVEKHGDNSHIVMKIADGAGGYEPENLVVSEVKQIFQPEWLKLKKKINLSDFWKLSTSDPNIERLGTDGSKWILEGQKDGLYHVVYRWSPTGKDYKSYREICEYLVTLTEFSKEELPSGDIY